MCTFRDGLTWVDDKVAGWDTAKPCERDATHEYVSDKLVIGLCADHAALFDNQNWLGTVRRK